MNPMLLTAVNKNVKKSIMTMTLIIPSRLECYGVWHVIHCTGETAVLDCTAVVWPKQSSYESLVNFFPVFDI